MTQSINQAMSRTIEVQNFPYLPLAPAQFLEGQNLFRGQVPCYDFRVQNEGGDAIFRMRSKPLNDFRIFSRVVFLVPAVNADSAVVLSVNLKKNILFIQKIATG